MMAGSVEALGTVLRGLGDWLAGREEGRRMPRSKARVLTEDKSKWNQREEEAWVVARLQTDD